MKIKYIASRYGIFLALIILVVFFSLTSQTFLTADNLINILRQVAIIGICSAGMTFIIITAGIDISAGSIIGVAAVTCTKLMVLGINPVFATLAALVIGTVLGLLNGFIINELYIPPLITTLGTMTALRGVAYLITKGLPIYGFPKSFTEIGQGYIWFVPIPVIIMIIILVLTYIVLNKTVFGRYVYGTGGNEEASRLSGVSIKKIKYAVYAIGGSLAALGGIILASRVNSGQPKAGDGYELDIITAVILGGVSIVGGEGSIVGVTVGVLIMGVLANGMILLNVDDYYQRIVKGLVLLAAVAIDQMSKRRGAKA